MKKVNKHKPMTMHEANQPMKISRKKAKLYNDLMDEIFSPMIKRLTEIMKQKDLLK